MSNEPWDYEDATDEELQKHKEEMEKKRLKAFNDLEEKYVD